MPELNDAPNYTDMFAKAFQAGREQSRQKGIQNALSMAPNDPSGAAAALTQYGEFAGANALMQNATAQRKLKIQQDVAPQVQAGDFAGAAKTAGAAGDFDLAGQIGQLDKQQQDHAAHVADVTSRAAFGLSQLPPEQRAGALQKIAPVLQEVGIPPEKLQNLDLSDAGLQQIAGQAISVKDQVAQQQKNQEINNTAENNRAMREQAAATAAEAARSHRANEGIAAANARSNAVRASMAGVQVLQDKDGTPYVYNVNQRKATTLDGQAYSPKGALKLGSGNAPRSPAAAATRAFMEANPDATPDQIMQFGSRLKAQGAATTAFATGKQGQLVNSLNVGIDHLGTLSEMSDALKNGNVQVFNKIAKDFAVATGNPAPTNFDAAKQLVAGEIVKVITAGGGGVHDREEAERAISRASSPAQLQGVISTQKKLFAGQLHGLRLQYKNSTGQDDFESHLTPQAAHELEAIPLDAPAPAAGGKAKPSLQSIFGH